MLIKFGNEGGIVNNVRIFNPAPYTVLGEPA